MAMSDVAFGLRNKADTLVLENCEDPGESIGFRRFRDAMACTMETVRHNQVSP